MASVNKYLVLGTMKEKKVQEEYRVMHVACIVFPLEAATSTSCHAV